ncbi:hypothetical protein C8R44DRAFT_725543 [Mycena epipterygia]|nr:hypothetical protein C8R44DRAFT_725543 [Mycena epipterygia]
MREASNIPAKGRRTAPTHGNDPAQDTSKARHPHHTRPARWPVTHITTHTPARKNAKPAASTPSWQKGLSATKQGAAQKGPNASTTTNAQRLAVAQVRRLQKQGGGPRGAEKELLSWIVDNRIGRPAVRYASGSPKTTTTTKRDLADWRQWRHNHRWRVGALQDDIEEEQCAMLARLGLDRGEQAKNSFALLSAARKRR